MDATLAFMPAEFVWLAQEQFVAENVAAHLELPKPERRLPASVLTADEVERMLNATEVSRPLELRERAMLRLDLRAATGTFAVEWYQAEHGHVQAGGDLSAGDWRELTAPWVGADVVVRLLKR